MAKEGIVKLVSVDTPDISGKTYMLWVAGQWLIGTIDDSVDKMWISRHISGGSLRIPTSGRDTKGEFKRIVVHYKEPMVCANPSTCNNHCVCNTEVQYPLNQSFWLEVINKELIDKPVNFIIMTTSNEKEIAEIVTKPKSTIDFEACLGVGDGSGDHYVYGSSESIKLLQDKLLKMEQMYTRERVKELIYNAWLSATSDDIYLAERAFNIWIKDNLNE
jgi:hypothetical protein